MKISHCFDQLHPLFHQRRMADVFQENHKFIAAGAHDHILFVKHLDQQMCQLHQHLIPKEMPVYIIGVFEIIHIQHHHAAGGIRILILQIFIDQFFSKKMVIERSQGILHGLLFQQRLPVFLSGNIFCENGKTDRRIRSLHGKNLKQ